MKALIFAGQGHPLQYGDYPNPELESGQVLVQLKAAALNHRDVWITQGLYPGIRTPSILGSDGAGLAQGREVIINPGIDWGENPAFPLRSYQVLGMPRDGTFAQYISVSPGRLQDKPSHLSWEEAAALPLAGLTAYRALFSKGQLQPGQKVLITGIGGGVALTACQLALAIGAEVWVTSGSDEKIERAMAIGAAGGVSYKESEWQQELASLAVVFDIIIDSAGGSEFSHLLRLCRPGGKIVVYGGSQGAATFSPQVLFWRQISIMGTSMGSDDEFAEMVKFVSQHKVKPIVDNTYALTEGNQAFMRMDKGLQFGKIVFKID